MRRLSITLPIDRWDPERGGAERYLDRVCRDLCHRGHAVTVCCLESSEPTDALPSELRIERLDVPRFPRWRRELAFAKRSVEAHEESGRDLLFAVRHALKADVYQPHGGCFRAARRGALAHLHPVLRAAKRVASTCRPTHHVLLWLDREVFRGSPEVTVVAISRKIEEELHTEYPDVECRVRRLYHGVDTGRFHDRDRGVLASRLRAAHGIEPKQRVAIFLSHRFRSKGLHHVLRALCLTESWHVVVCGRDDPRPFRSLARRLGIERRVHFAGVVRDSREVLAGADALVLPTYYDACSLAVLEALACGTPVVTTPQSGSGELMESGTHGFIVERPDGWREIVAALGAIDGDWDAFHTAALSLRDDLGWDRHVDRLEAILVEAARQVRAEL